MKLCTRNTEDPWFLSLTAAKWVLAAIVVWSPATVVRADTWNAVVDWAQRLELGPLVGGTVTATFSETGDRVAKGEELMQIDPAPYRHRVQTAEARVESTGVDRDSSRQHHERQEELYDIGSLSTVQLDESAYALKRAESAHRLAQAELDLARYNLEKTTTRAPIDAWVIDKRVFVGQNLSTSQVIPVSYVVAPTGEYIVRISPPPDTAALSVVGTPVRVEINGETYDGEIIFPRASDRPEPGHLTARFETKDVLILPGTAATVSISR